MTLPDQIRKIIKESKKSQRQMAKDAKMQVSSLQRIKEPGWGTQILQAVKILDSLGYNFNVMNKKQKQLIEEIKGKLAQEAKNKDREIAHEKADYLLCELLSELGLNDVVEIYKKVGKWYG